MIFVRRFTIFTLGALCFSATSALSQPVWPYPTIRRIAIEVIPGPGRGNIGAAVISADLYRRAGFDGEITFFINPTKSDVGTKFSSMVSGYSPTAADIQTVGSPKQRFRVVNYKNWGDLDQGAFDFDLLLRLGTSDENHFVYGRSSPIVKTRVVASSPIFLPGPGTTFAFNSGAGKSNSPDIYLSSISQRFKADVLEYGAYGDAEVQKAREILARPGGKGTLEKTITGLLREDARRGGKAYYAALADLLERPDFVAKASALVYGIGDTHLTGNQLSVYLRALAGRSTTSEAPTVVLSASQLNPTELDRFRSENPAMHFIDLQRGETLPGRLVRGETYFVHVGGVSHSVYARLLAYTGLPPLVSGDAAFSAVLELKRPFLLTRVPLSQSTYFMLSDLLTEAGHEDLSEILAAVTEGNIWQEPPSIDAFLSEKAYSAFAEIGQAFRRPRSLTFAAIADTILSDPKRLSRSLQKRWPKAYSQPKVYEIEAGTCVDLLAPVPQ